MTEQAGRELMASIHGVVMAKLAAAEGMEDDHEAEVVAAINYTLDEYGNRIAERVEQMNMIVGQLIAIVEANSAQTGV